jgi:Tol biopolymer transport system component
VWSPDGRYIAFAVGLTEGPGTGTFIMNADGTNLRRVDLWSFSKPAWQPIT